MKSKFPKRQDQDLDEILTKPYSNKVLTNELQTLKSNFSLFEKKYKNESESSKKEKKQEKNSIEKKLSSLEKDTKEMKNIMKENKPKIPNNLDQRLRDVEQLKHPKIVVKGDTDIGNQLEVMSNRISDLEVDLKGILFDFFCLISFFFR